MKLLIQNDPARFHEETASYRKHMLPMVKLMSDMPGDQPQVRLYSRYLLWCIRRLEYSYVLDRLERLPDAHLRVLDVGCGVTPFPNAMARMGSDVTAVDPFREEIEFMRRHANDTFDTNVRYHCEDGRNLSFPDATFDIVTCISVLEHMSGSEARECLTELRRVLRPGGVALFTTDFIPQDSTHPIHGTDGGVRSKRETPYQLHTLRNELMTAPGLAHAKGTFLKECESLTEEEVRAFWRAHRFEGCLYEQDRDYIAIGFEIGGYR